MIFYYLFYNFYESDNMAEYNDKQLLQTLVFGLEEDNQLNELYNNQLLDIMEISKIHKSSRWYY